MKNPRWALSGHNGQVHLKPKRALFGLAIWVMTLTHDPDLGDLDFLPPFLIVTLILVTLTYDLGI